MNHLDTFSGIGGWALASRWMGWNTVAFVEKEKFCHKVLNKNFPGVPIHDDIFTFSGKPFRGRVDILTGSTPCQPFSQAGKRGGSNDERHLFPEFLRVVAEVEPRWIVIENVYGLLGIESGQVFEEYHTQLESKGYSVQTVCIPASALNAPHRRDRLWIVARSNSNTNEQRLQGQSERSSERVWGRHQRHDSNVRNATGINARKVTTVWQRATAESCGGNAFTRHSNIEGLQIGGQQPELETIFESNGTEYADSDAADTDNAGSGTRQPRPNAKRPPLGEERQQPQFESSGHGGDAAHARCGQGAENATDAYTTGERLERSIGSIIQGRESRLASNDWQRDWRDVAARTCVRGMDDGVSVELDIIGSRDNRVHRLKALGNAIVPGIAYEIFRAIEEDGSHLLGMGAVLDISR